VRFETGQLEAYRAGVRLFYISEDNKGVIKNSIHMINPVCRCHCPGNYVTVCNRRLPLWLRSRQWYSRLVQAEHQTVEDQGEWLMTVSLPLGNSHYGLISCSVYDVNNII